MNQDTNPALEADTAHDQSADVASDDDLMRRFQQGDPRAFDELLERHRRPLFAYLRRSTGSTADAEDLFQEVFIKVIRAAPRWRADAKVSTWLYAIARNAAIDGARRRRTQPTQAAVFARDDAPDPVDELPDERKTADARLLDDEHQRAIAEIIAELPAAQREAFLLKRDGMTFDAIATVVDASRNTVKSRLRYALEKLRAGLIERHLLEPPRAGERP